MFSNMLNQKKYVSRKQNFTQTIPLKVIENTMPHKSGSPEGLKK